MTHKILIEPEQLIVIKSGRKKHYLCHKSVKVEMGDEICFYLAYSPSSDPEVNVRL